MFLFLLKGTKVKKMKKLNLIIINLYSNAICFHQLLNYFYKTESKSKRRVAV